MVNIGHKKIGPGEPVFIIAEIGINHNQDIGMAKRLIDVAAQAGCDAAKFQTFTAKALYVDRKLSGTYHLMGKDVPIYDLHTGLEMPHGWIPELMEHCRKQGILFFSTPVEPSGTDALNQHGVEVFKISSYDMTNLPLVDYVAQKGKPIIFSTGGSTLGEVEETVAVIKSRQVPFAIMHCIAKYPAPFRYANLAVMDTLRQAFQAPVGFSDNGFSDEKGVIDALRVPCSAAQAGADLFEIHITLDRSLPGPDQGFATLPQELKILVREMQNIRHHFNKGEHFQIDPELWGSSVKKTYDVEEYVRNFAYKSLYACRAIRKGEKLTSDNIRVLRPGQHKRGLEPKYFSLVTQKACAAKEIPAWEPITWESILSPGEPLNAPQNPDSV